MDNNTRIESLQEEIQELEKQLDEEIADHKKDNIIYNTKLQKILEIIKETELI